jgi:S1-C subfamily serine protease
VGGTTITIEWKEFGVGLNFTPTVLSDGKISRLEMDFGKSFKHARSNQIINAEAEKNLEPVYGLDGPATQVINDMKQFFRQGVIIIAMFTFLLLGCKSGYTFQIPTDELTKLDKYVVAIGLKFWKTDTSSGKSKVVKVVLGAGVLVKKYERKILVTAKHVVFDNNGKGPLIPHLYIWGKKIDGNDFEYSLQKDVKGIWEKVEWIKHSDDEIDIVATIITTSDKKDIVEFLPFEEYKYVSEAKKGEDIYYLGFPIAHYNLFHRDHVNVSTPVLRKGMVALNEKEERYFYIDAPVAGGNSGGPVFKLDENGNPKLLGIVYRYLPFEKGKHIVHTGLGAVYAADCIEEILESEAFKGTK